MKITKCMAFGCDVSVRADQRPAHVMCYAHWRQVPFDLRDRIMYYWRPSQEHGVSPNGMWTVLVDKACQYIEDLAADPA